MKNSKQNIRLIVISFFWMLAINLLLLVSRGSTVAQSVCQLRKNKDSIKVYVCPTGHLKLRAVRRSFTVNASYSEILALFLDVTHFSNWQYKTKCASVLNRPRLINTNLYLEKSCLGLVWLSVKIRFFRFKRLIS